MSVFIPYGSKQYVMVPQVLRVDGIQIAPTDDDNPAMMAFKAVDDSTEPDTNNPPIAADFHAGTWERIEGIDYIKCLVGGSGDGTVALTPGRYRIYTRFADSPEDIWIPCDYATIGANPAA